MRILFMGTDKFAVPALKALIDNGYDIVGVVTQPDQPKGRGLKVTPPPVKELALAHNLPIYQPAKVRDESFVQKIRDEFRPDIIIVSAFGQILSRSILEIPKYGCINLHPSLLPKYRGPAPIQRAIMNGETETGVTIMMVDEGQDTGDIIMQRAVAIDLSDTGETLSQKLSEISADMLIEVLNLREDGELVLPRHPQDSSKATYAPKLTKEDGLINWENSSKQIHDLIRGAIPWPVAYTSFRSRTLRIWKSKIVNGDYANLKAQPGTIVCVSPELVVATGQGAISIEVLQPADKAKISAKDFVNGYRVKIGDQLGS